MITRSASVMSKTPRYPENMIKGRIAETLIQELFLSEGFNVFHYGMENTIPGIMKLLDEVKGDVAHQIRNMPDFVIQHKKNKNLFFIEVKFRASGDFKLGGNLGLREDYPFDNAFIIVVSKRHIKCITVEELRNGKEVTEKSKNYLGSREEFGMDKENIIQFCKFAVKFFENV
jgi:hypothetical protein